MRCSGNCSADRSDICFTSAWKMWISRKDGSEGEVLPGVLYGDTDIPAGIARMQFVPFLVFTAAGSLLWNTVLVYAGRIAGDSWEKVSAALGVYSDLFLMIAGISIAFAVLFRGCGERRKL